jgi:hypothetical protein
MVNFNPQVYFQLTFLEITQQERYSNLCKKFKTIYSIQPSHVVRVPGVLNFPSGSIIELQSTSIFFNLNRDLLLAVGEYQPPAEGAENEKG